MKLKQRVLVWVGVLVVCCVFLILHILSPSVNNKASADLKSQSKEKDLTWRINPSEEKVDHSGPQADKALQDIKAHLAVMRKDLDLSNYSSNADHNLNSASKKKQLQEFILKDNVFKDNAEEIAEIAEILRDRGMVKPAVNLTDNNPPVPPTDKPQPKSHEKVPASKTHAFHSSEVPYKTFPNYNAQDERLMSFHFPESAYKTLSSQMEQYHRTHKHVKYDSPALLKNPYKSVDKPYQVWHTHIHQYALYSPDDPALQAVIQELRESPLVDLYQHDGGTQIKLVYYLQSGLRAMFKPQRFPKDQETLPDHFYFTDYERYFSEIAAFNLDLALGFHRVPPVVGRKINVTHDVKRHADKDLLKTFFVSPAGNVCFHGQCDYYCDTGHAVCGHPEIMEGSLMAFLPTSTRTQRESWKHPWRRSYHKRKKANWEVDPNYCMGVKKTPPYNSGRRLLDLMDMAVFDFLTGNMDRHHYESFTGFGNFTFTLLYDNGRGFGKSRHDELSILAPIYQCCLMRYSTLQKLLKFYAGPQHLSDIMRELMAGDETRPVLLEKHLTALDRRVHIILKTVYECTRKNRFTSVVKDDGF